MSNDTKWVIGTVLGTAIALAGLMFAQSASLNGRMDRQEDRLRAVEDRLRAVEIGLAEIRVPISGRGRDPANGGQSPIVTLSPRGG